MSSSYSFFPFIGRSTKPLWFAVCLLVGSHFAPAQELQSIAAGAKADLEKALTELADVRKTIETEKLPLAREVNGLEQQVIDQKAALQKAERFQENQLVELNALKNQVKARNEEVKYVGALLSEYSRAFRTRTHVVEAARIKPVLDAYDAATASVDLSEAARISKQGELLKAALDRVQSIAGGEQFETSVLGLVGKMEKGKVALMGPVAIFASSETPLVGVVQLELNKADPSVFPLPDGMTAAARELATTGKGSIDLDSTLGGAIKIAAIKESIVQHFLKGGVVMWPMLGLGFAALVVGLIRWFQLSRVRLATEKDLQDVLEELDKGGRKAARRRAEAIAGPAGEMLVTGVDHLDEKKEYIEEVLYEKMLLTKPKLEALLPFIALTAASAPLLGLLGTVTGMISTFNLISLFGTGDPKTMSSGISEALITTEFGLYIAIPSLMLHAFLSRKAKGVLGGMEQTAVGFINGLPERQFEQL
jgi:biopolymer transport protein ExbB